MKRISKRTLAAAAAVTVLAAGAGTALATAQTGTGSGSGMGMRQGGPMREGPMHGHLDAVATYLGLTAAELRTQLQGGKTLAQVATAQGKSVDGLKAAIVVEAKEHLDEAVAAGRLTADQAKQMLERIQANVDAMVNRTGPPEGRGPGGLMHGPGFMQRVASYLGLTAAELRTQLQGGKSLAQIATAQGKSVDGLKDAIVAAAKAGFDKALAGLKANLDEIVNRTGLPGPPGR